MTKSDKTSQIVVLTRQEQLFLEQKHDILLLLKHLAESEEVTVKLVLDRLYDIGANNLINQKISSPILKRVLLNSTKIPKPVFRIIAYYWFKQNCPQLITDWLIEQVAFTAIESDIEEIVEMNSNSLQNTELELLKIKQLKSQVRLLTRILIIVIAALLGSFTWLFYITQIQPESNLQPANFCPTCIEE